MESLLGYLVYGVGGLVIVLFLGSAFLAQRKNSRASVDQENQENQEDQTDQENQDQDQEDLENLRDLKNENLDEEFLARENAQVSLVSRVKAGLISTFSTFKKGRAGKNHPQIEPKFTVDSNQPTSFGSKANPTDEFTENFSANSNGTIRGVANQTNDDSAESQSFLSLLIVAPRGQAFYGEDLLAVFERVGLTHGKYQIFHALDPHTKRPIFSVASAIKPGIFELGYMAKYTTPGLNFFMDLNSSEDLRADFRKILGSVYEISTDLGGEILDSRRQRLTQSSVSEYLAKIKGIEASSRAFV